MSSSASVLLVAVWLSAFAGVAIGAVSLWAGTAPEWAVLRAVGGFAAFMVLGLVAEATTRHGLAAAPPGGSGGGGGATVEGSGRAGGDVGADQVEALEAEVLSVADAEERSDGRV